ncbi:MAG: DUF99 family protein [Promethearchaeota archaeon]
MKENPIIIGFDDASFNLKAQANKTQLIGVVCQGYRVIKVVKTEIAIDGYDATNKIIELIEQNEKHVQFIFTHTITFAGFNIVDLEKTHNEINKPIIAINEKDVDLELVISTLKQKFPNRCNEKIRNIIQAGNLYYTTVQTAGGPSTVYFHLKGMEFYEVNSLLQKVCIDSKLPECLRIAHLIGRIF